MQTNNTSLSYKPSPETAIINTLIQMKSNGIKESTRNQANRHLTTIRNHTDIFNPEAVKQYISNAIIEKKCSNQGKPLDPQSRNVIVYAYNYFCTVNQIQWKKPFYKFSEKTPIIPTTENVNKIIGTATKRYTLIFTLLDETGAEAIELHNVNAKRDIDQQQGIISITGVKMHDSGTYKLKATTAEMLRTYLANTPEEYPFPQSKIMGQQWDNTRRRAAAKFSQPELIKIKMQNLRNHSGAVLYYKTLDIYAVKRHLRHKTLKQTQHYLDGMPQTTDQGEWTTKAIKTNTPTTLQEILTLTEQGYTKADEIDGYKIYKKRK